MPRKSKYTNLYKKKFGKNPIPFPHFVLETKKEVYFRILSGFPANLAIKPIMREHFSDEYTGIIASDKTWEKLMKNLPPHFLIQKKKTVVFLIKGIFPENIFLNKYMSIFPEGYKGEIIRCEENFYKMRVKANNTKNK